jgi:hypothetical protein
MSHVRTIDLMSDPRVPSWLANQMAAVNTDARRAKIIGDEDRLDELRVEAERLMRIAHPYLELPMPPEPVAALPAPADDIAEVEAMITQMEAPASQTTSLPARYRTRYDPGYLAPVSAKPRPWTVLAIGFGLLFAALGAGAWFLRRR